MRNRQRHMFVAIAFVIAAGYFAATINWASVSASFSAAGAIDASSDALSSAVTWALRGAAILLILLIAKLGRRAPRQFEEREISGR